MSTQEVVWVDGDKKNLLVILRDSNQDSSHYFYFPAEITFPRIIKLVDIEPLQRRSVPLGGMKLDVMLSRLHYWGLLIWVGFDPVDVAGEGRPVCIFAPRVHTPLIWFKNAKKYPIRAEPISNAPSLNPLQKIEWLAAISFLTATFRKMSLNNPEPYPSILREEKPEAIADPDQKFGRSNIVANSRFIFVVGDPSAVAQVRGMLVDSAGNMTSPKLDAFLGTAGVV